MRFKVELHPDVDRFVWHQCTADERSQFREMCRRISEDPIHHSNLATNPKLSRYVVRFARFGSCIALFGFDRARQKIRIRQCQRAKKPEANGLHGESNDA